jgi:multidrug efflux pump subunit AcrA (membrane-fusion protein)
VIKRCRPVLFIAGLLAALSAQSKELDTADIVASAPGRIEGANDVTQIGVAATGIIEKLFVKAGDRVKAGQVLVQVNCRVIEAEIREREAQMLALISL